MINDKIISMEKLISDKEVLNAINYSIEDNKINDDKLDYYRINIADDSRYTFKIQVEDIAETGLIFVKYRGKQYRLIYNKNNSMAIMLK